MKEKPDLLDWLHDCDLLRLDYTVAETGERRLTMVIQIPEDLGLPKWNGQRVNISCDDVLLLEWKAWGFTTGAESIDSWNDAPPETYAGKVAGLLQMGIKPATFAWKVTFHTGSEMLILCSGVDIRLTD